MSVWTRREFLQHVANGVGGLAATGLAPRDAGAEEAAPPNVLIIVVDDLNDWVGCLGGHPQAKTPNIDRLASLGTLFTRAYCAAPACNPSRTSLFTGIRPSTSGVYGNRHPWRAVLPDAVTLPTAFQRAGYETIGCGKVFHYEEPRSWDGSEELYDERNDPSEWRNLAHRPDLEPTRRELAAWLPETDAPPGPIDPNFRRGRSSGRAHRPAPAR